MTINIILIVLWAILGAIHLSRENVSKLCYACTWIALIMALITNLIGA
jgi:hypothetical protein